MENIKVKDLVGIRLITMADGEVLRDAILQGLKGNKEIEVDFSDCTRVAAPFFTACFGNPKIYKQMDKERIGITGTDEVMRYYIDTMPDNHRDWIKRKWSIRCQWQNFRYWLAGKIAGGDIV